jgi:group I intron endonuclease
MKNNIELKNYNKSGIYKIENIENGFVYIGSAYNFYNRYRVHKSRLSRGKHDNYHLQKSYNKYGVEKFEFSIVEIVDNIDNIYDIEKFYINKFFGTKCYNINTETQPHINLISWNDSREKEFSLISPDGELRFFKGYVRAGKELGILPSGIRQVVIGKIKSYKGWRTIDNKDYDYKNYRKIKNKGAKLHDIKLLSPSGEIIGPIFNIEEFARLNNIHPSIIFNIIAKRTRYSNGWSLYEGSIKKPIEKNAKLYDICLISPSGEVFDGIENLAKFCRENNVQIASIRKLIKGTIKRKSYKGWKLKENHHVKN